MVKGIETFENFFRDFSQEYVLIGGTACDLLMEEAGIEFRATKDLDIVLIVEALTEKFGMKFWEFFRLSALISSDKKLNLNGSILEDMEKFINLIKDEPIDLKSIGIKRRTKEEIIDLIHVPRIPPPLNYLARINESEGGRMNRFMNV